MIDDWNRTSDRNTTRVVPPAQRSDGADIRRNYNRMIKNQQKRITQENQEYFSPEYLQQEKFYVLHEISKLKHEIKPLTIQYQKLLAEKEKVLPTPDEGASPDRTELYSDITEEQKNRQQLEEELAKERRHFSEGTRFRLQYEIQIDTQNIQSILDQIEGEKSLIDQKNKQLESITNSQLADTIRTQDNQIDQLQRQLKDLKAEEKELKQKAMEYLKDSAYSSMDAREINSMKKKLQILDTIQLRKSSEYRKRRNELEKQVQTLRDQIAQKKKKKQERQEKENWKKNLKIKEIVVTEDDYAPYQPRTMVNHAMPQNQGLPPLNPNSSRRRTPTNKQRQQQYSYQQQNDNDNYYYSQEQNHQEQYQNYQQQQQNEYNYYENNQYEQNQQQNADENYNNYYQSEDQQNYSQDQQQQQYQEEQQPIDTAQSENDASNQERSVEPQSDQQQVEENNETSINIIPDVLAQQSQQQQQETQDNIPNLEDPQNNITASEENAQQTEIVQENQEQQSQENDQANSNGNGMNLIKDTLANIV